MKINLQDKHRIIQRGDYFEWTLNSEKIAFLIRCAFASGLNTNIREDIENIEGFFKVVLSAKSLGRETFYIDIFEGYCRDCFFYALHALNDNALVDYEEGCVVFPKTEIRLRILEKIEG